MSDIIIKPEVVEAREKQKARDKQHERRRLAHEYMRSFCASHFPDTRLDTGKEDAAAFVGIALDLADELIRQTDPEKP